MEEAPELGKAFSLYLRREADYLMRSLKQHLVKRSNAQTVDELFAELVDLIVAHYPRIPRDETIQELQERERSFPTALGHAIAVPHAYSHLLETRLCVVAMVPGGIDFQAPDDEPVKLVFLLLSPADDPEGHLATMAEIARLVSDRPTREGLLEAGSEEDILRIVGDFASLQRTIPAASGPKAQAVDAAIAEKQQPQEQS